MRGIVYLKLGWGRVGRRAMVSVRLLGLRRGMETGDPAQCDTFSGAI
jgi:hypothetical protein